MYCDALVDAINLDFHDRLQGDSAVGGILIVITAILLFVKMQIYGAGNKGKKPTYRT